MLKPTPLPGTHVGCGADKHLAPGPATAPHETVRHSRGCPSLISCWLEAPHSPDGDTEEVTWTNHPQRGHLPL